MSAGLTTADRDALLRVVDQTWTRDVFNFPALEAAVGRIVEQAKAAALRDAAVDLRANAATAWGAGAPWFTTGTQVADVAAGWLEESADELAEGGDDS
jgi:hypothetical protein